MAQQDKVSSVLKKVIIFILSLNILFALLQAGIFMVANQSTFLIVSLVKILVSATFIYFIVKKGHTIYLILAGFSGLSITSTFRQLSSLQTTFDKFLVSYDFITITFIIVSSLLIYLKTASSKNKLVFVLRALNKKEIPFWSPATFFALGLSCVLITLSLFLPFGLLENKETKLVSLMLNSMSVFSLFLLLSVIFAVYSIAKKSYLKSYLASIFVGGFLLLTMDKYQAIVGKPYLFGQNILTFAALLCVLIFASGIFVIAGAVLKKDYFKHSKY